MIYETPEIDAPLRQGDIFLSLPKATFSLKTIPVIQDGKCVEKSWMDLSRSGSIAEAIVSVGAVAAIVISQDCDTSRAPEISLCEIRPFTQVHPRAKETSKISSWVSVITRDARSNPKWFYLPPEEGLFANRMGVDFFSTFRLSREDLEANRELRRSRLISLAKTHFRERISEFFRRYPYDEWYPLTKDEFATYKQTNAEAEPFSWQA